MAEILNYSKPKPTLITKRRITGVILLIAFSIVTWKCFTIYVKPWLAEREIRRLRIAVVTAQDACLKFTASPEILVYTDDPGDVARLSGSAGYHRFGAIAEILENKKWRELEDLYNAGWTANLIVDPTLGFLHERISPWGNRRLLTVTINPQGLIEPFVIVPATNTTLPLYRRRNQLILIRDDGHPLNLFAGQVDPFNNSHFSIGYLIDGRRGTLDGYLNDDDSIAFTSQSCVLKTWPQYSEAFLESAAPCPGPAAPICTIINKDPTPEWRALAISPDGRTLAAAREEYWRDPVIFFNADTGQQISTIPRTLGPAGTTALAFSPDGSLLAIGSNTNVILWDIANKKIREFGLRYAFGRVVRLIFLSDKQLLAESKDWGLQIFDVDTGQVRSSVSVPKLSGFAIDPTHRIVVTSTSEKTEGNSILQFWNLQGGTQLRSTRIDNQTDLASRGAHLAWSPDGTTILLATDEIRAIDAHTGKLLWNRFVPDVSNKVDFHLPPVFSPDGRMFCINRYELNVFDFPNADTQKTLGRLLNDSSPCPAVWSADSKRLAAPQGRNAICVWDMTEKPAASQP